MEHSRAIMEDAGQAIEGDASSSKASDAPNKQTQLRNSSSDGDRKTNNYERRKRKGDFHDSSMRHGSKRGRFDDSRDNRRNKKSDLGRGEYLYVFFPQPQSYNIYRH